MTNSKFQISTNNQAPNSKAFGILKIAIWILFGAWFLGFIISTAHVAEAATNIFPENENRHAWNDAIGWIDFYGSNTVTITATKIEGYTNDISPGSLYGNIGLDCATTPNGNICGGAAGNWFVAHDGAGNLSGWAWSDAVGWISFWCGDTGVCGTANYRTVIDLSTGIFSGWAWNDVVGWISFCGNATGGSGATGGCPLSPTYKVRTSYTPPPPPPGSGGGFGGSVSLTSSIFDTQVSQGVAFNWLMWRGALNGGRVGFQLASSNNSGGPWNYYGPDGLATSYYEPASDAQIKIPLTGLNHHNNKRYVRYRLFLDAPGASNPQVDDVIINFSP